MLTKMKFRDFTWPNNPHSFTVEHRRELRCRKLPFQAYRVQDMGEGLCVLRGEGEFVGEGAYESYLRLAELCIDGTPCLLVHPVWPACTAFLAEVKLRQEPQENYVSYEFEFWRSSDGAKRGTLRLELAPTEHTVSEGEDFWEIVGKSGLSADRILALNPQLMNPNRLQTGEIIRLSEV